MPGPQRRRLVEDERLAVEAGDAAARLLDQERPGADVPLVLRRERERGVAVAGGQLGQLEGDAAGQHDLAARLEGVPLAALVLGAARQHLGVARRRRCVLTRAGAPFSVVPWPRTAT